MSRDTEAEARVTQIWPSLKGQRKKKGGRAIAIDVLFFRDGGIACGPLVVFRQSAYTCRSNYRPLKTTQKYFRRKGWREDLARAINSAAFNLIYPLMPENLSGNARAFSLIVARISRRFARLPHLLMRISRDLFFEIFPTRSILTENGMKKFGYLELTEIPWDFFFWKFFWSNRYRYRARMGLKIIWIFGISGEARGFK